MPASTKSTRSRSRKGANTKGSRKGATKPTSRKATGRKQSGTDKALAAKQKAAKEKAAAERQAKREQREREAAEARQAEIDSGALVVDGDGEFHATEARENPTVDNRAAAVLKDLQATKKSGVPVLGRELQDEHGGGWPQYLSFFSMLKSEGHVREYRRRGEGGTGVAYLWVQD